MTRASYVVECNLQMKCSHSLTVASVRGSLPSCERSSVFSRKIGNAFRFVWPAKLCLILSVHGRALMPAQVQD